MTYKPGDQPDPAFAAFFAGDWQRLLERVIIPGTDPGHVSWDRRAAYLYWTLAESAKAGWDSLEWEGGGRPDKVNTPLTEWIAEENADLLGPSLAEAVKIPNPFEYPSARGQATVGKVGFALTMFDNHFGDEDCKPTPGGVRLTFDSSKW